jgi:hypothetical protein
MPLIESIPLQYAQPLLPGGMILPEGVTILFGRESSGKSLIAAWQARMLAEAGKRVLVCDLEGRPALWVQRLQGVPHERIELINPDGDLKERKSWMADQLTAFDPDVVIVDSAFYALPLSQRGYSEHWAIRELYRIMRSWEVPSLLIAHTQKQPSDNDPTPLGSVQWHAQAQLGAYVTTDKDNGNMTLTFTKANDRELPSPRLLHWDWATSSMSELEPVVIITDKQLVLKILREKGHRFTAKEIANELKEHGRRVDYRWIEAFLVDQAKYDRRLSNNVATGWLYQA